MTLAASIRCAAPGRSTVNVRDVTDPIRELVRSRRVVDPKALADPDVPLGEV
ncbi:hypothetical protein ABZX88_28380 [Kitasatospora aureofaciens]|uniref:hypothetical protein n=1 Tax=Kitasatospora aureofaciens TaxID=1894 RepID=UPI0033BE8169